MNFASAVAGAKKNFFRGMKSHNTDKEKEQM
jgi:hypothetical protein